jgi:transposase
MSHQAKTANFAGQDFFIGIDVHSKSWKVTIRNNHMELRTFSMNPSPQELYSHMNKNYSNGHYLSVYESGFCGYWIHRHLTKLGIDNRIVNPADVPTTKKEKDQKRDPIDSRKLARELENDSLKGIYIPTEKQQALRSVSRLYMQIIGDRTRLKLRIKSYLHFNGIPIPQKSEISPWSGHFIHWLKKLAFSQKESHYQLQQLLAALEQKRQQSLQILKHIRKISQQVPAIGYLNSVCGLGLITAFTFYAEVMDIKRFNNTDKLACYVGLVPSVNASGDKEIIKGLTMRHNSFLRRRIIESAWVAVRTDPAMTHAFSQLIKRMPKQKAIIRIARKLLGRLRHVWLNEEKYVKGVVE